MGRFLLGLLCAGALFWIWDRWGADAIEASPKDETGLFAEGGGADDASAAQITQEPLRAVEEFGDLTLDQFLERFRAGTGEARETAWSILDRGKEPARSRLAAKVLAMVEDEGDPERALALLGRRNYFLHSEEGRSGVRSVAASIESLQEDAKAVELGTRLLEVCMRGPIQRGDREARATVDRVWSGYQKAVHRHVFDPTNLAQAETYRVQPGDALARIARRASRNGVTLESGTLAMLNRIHNPNALREGQVIKIPTQPLRTVLEKASFLMAVYVGDAIIRLYWVGHGADGKTPETEFVISEKLKDPAWYAPDGEVHPAGSPGNILGGYFVKFEHESYQGFGAHGTPKPETICTESSMGCIRMLAADIADYFQIIPRGSAVVVRNHR